MLTSKNVSRHNAVHFLNIPTSKIEFRTRCALHILTSKCASRLAACTFSSSQLPKVLRTWCDFHTLTSTCASRQNAVQFFNISSSNRVRMWCVFHAWTSKCASRHNAMHLFSDICFPVFSDSPRLCSSICPYCWKFEFKFSSMNEFALQISPATIF